MIRIGVKTLFNLIPGNTIAIIHLKKNRKKTFNGLLCTEVLKNNPVMTA